MQMKLGIIGGSGVYDIAGLENPQWQTVTSPWGAASDAVLTGRLDGLDMVFLPRHGRGHIHSPSTVPYRANIDVLKRLGVTDILSVSACGSFHEDLAPGDFVMVDQYIDRTFTRESSFFGPGCVAHVSVAHPTCRRLSSLCQSVAQDLGIRTHGRGTYLAMEGPQFSTLAESQLYRNVWGCDVIGMTGMPEAKLAREAEMCYASIAMITDYDCWHADHGSVQVSDVVRVMTANAQAARALIAQMPAVLGQGPRSRCTQGCDHALDHAIMTDAKKRDRALLAKLDAVAGRVLGET